MSIENKCMFCEKTFTDKYILTNHQRSSKKCLKIQERKNTPNIVKKLHKCDYCPKELASKQSLNNHLDTCRNKIKQELFEMKDFLEKFKAIEERIQIIENKPVPDITTKEKMIEMQQEVVEKTKIKKNIQQPVKKIEENCFVPYKKRKEWSVHSTTSLVFNVGKKVIGKLETDDEGYEFLGDLSNDDLETCKKLGFKVDN